MKKLKILLILPLIISLNLKAQHCRWDGTDVMVFAIKSNVDDTLSINNLKVTVTDSLGNPLFANYLIDGNKKTIQLTVFQNRIEPDFNVKKIHDPYDVRCFWFAKNNYVLVSSFVELRNKNMQIIIEDIDGKENGGTFAKYSFSPDLKMTYPLCSRFSFWESGPGMGFSDNYKPVIIVLKKEFR